MSKYDPDPTKPYGVCSTCGEEIADQVWPHGATLARKVATDARRREYQLPAFAARGGGE